METNEIDKKTLLIGLIIALIIIIIGIVISFLLINIKKGDNKDYIIKDYVYKIRYDFNKESYIYLLKNDVIKVLKVTDLGDNCEQNNCYSIDGKHYYEETKINFSSEKKQIALRIIKEVAKKSNKKEFNAKELNLTEEEDNVLKAITLNYPGLIETN